MHEGDTEANCHLIPMNSSPANRVIIKLVRALTASREYEVATNDIRQAFLQTEHIKREVYVHPPIEVRVSPEKVCVLRPACYSLVEASRVYFFHHANEHKNLSFIPLQFDPTTFVLRQKNQMKAVYTSHIDYIYIYISSTLTLYCPWG